MNCRPILSSQFAQLSDLDLDKVHERDEKHIIMPV